MQYSSERAGRLDQAKDAPEMRTSAGLQQRSELCHNRKTLTHSMSKLPAVGDFVSVIYWDHVNFRNSDPLIVSPERPRRGGGLRADGDPP